MSSSFGRFGAPAFTTAPPSATFSYEPPTFLGIKCPCCTSMKLFKDEIGLRQHLNSQVHHLSNESGFLCLTCDVERPRSFATLESLKQHTRDKHYKETRKAMDLKKKEDFSLNSVLLDLTEELSRLRILIERQIELDTVGGQQQKDAAATSSESEESKRLLLPTSKIPRTPLLAFVPLSLPSPPHSPKAPSLHSPIPELVIFSSDTSIDEATSFGSISSGSFVEGNDGSSDDSDDQLPRHHRDQKAPLLQSRVPELVNFSSDSGSISGDSLVQDDGCGDSLVHTVGDSDDEEEGSFPLSQRLVGGVWCGGDGSLEDLEDGFVALRVLE